MLLPPHQRHRRQYACPPGGWRITGMISLAINAILILSLMWGRTSDTSSTLPTGVAPAGAPTHFFNSIRPARPSIPVPAHSRPAEQVSTPADETSVVESADAAAAPAMPPLLFVVVSASRPNGTDYVSTLLTSIFDGFYASPLPSLGSKIRVLMYDPDSPDARRPASFFDALPPEVEVHTRPAEALAQLATVNTNPALDKHHDPPDRIAWRTRGSKDFESVLSLAHAQSPLGWPYAIVLQDDVQLSSTFFSRVQGILSSPEAAVPPSPPWLAWTLFHAKAFDHGKHVADGAPYQFEACAQAMLYRTEAMGGLIQYVSQHWREDPDDWVLRDYQRSSRALVRVAQPSIVQHVGRVSSLAAKAKDGGGIVSGCWAPDFVA